MTSIRRRDGKPQWITEGNPKGQSLVRTDLQGRSGAKFDERWLQNLLYVHPDLFPVEQIEPGFGELISACRELPVTIGGGRTGALDNLYLTCDGGLVLVEAKLWRNPEARRSAVAQAMEYAAAIFRMGYEELQSAIIRARKSDDSAEKSLAEIVKGHTPDFDEAEFIDAVARNLRRGRAIIAVVGDGIREDILPLVDLLQSHAGHRFTFALVELAIYEAPISGIRVVIPSVLAQTTLIERGVIRIDGEAGGVSIHAPDTRPASSTTPEGRRGVSIGEDEFYELLSQRNNSWPLLVRSFLERAEAIGLYAERKGGLNIKHASPEGLPLNLGTISKEGRIDTDPATWRNRTKFGRRYNETLAKAMGGSVKEQKGGAESGVRTAAGTMPDISDLLPEHEQAWLEAAQEYVSDIFSAADRAEEK